MLIASGAQGADSVGDRLDKALEVAFARYTTLAADSTLAPLVPPRISVKPGAAFEQASALREFLVAVGDLSPDTVIEDAVYGRALVEGLKRFQTRHGLTADGVIGSKTAAALAVPLVDRARQIARARDRLRELPHIEGRIVLINIAMFQLWAWDAVERPPSVAMRVVVGRAGRTPTPPISGRIEYLIVRPYWNVPASIMRGEILPKLARDPHYLERENLEIVSGAGDDAQIVAPSEYAIAHLRAGAFRLRQRPGTWNALGRLKFVFPNPQDVYLHDTPARSLFALPRRDFSHGCVRVEDAAGLGAWTLADQPEWTRERIIEGMNGSRTRRIDLKQSVPIVLFYATAMVWPTDGTIHFADDIYGVDAQER